MDALGGMIRQAGEHVGEPGLWIDVVELGGGDEGVDRGGPTPVDYVNALYARWLGLTSLRWSLRSKMVRESPSA